MILQALKGYYERKQAELPPEGFQSVEIPFVIVINRAGSFIQLRDTREGKRGRQFVVPRAETRSGTMAWSKPNLLWDHYGFVLGEPKGLTEADKVMAARQHKAFVERVTAVARDLGDDHPVHAVALFLERGEFSVVRDAPGWSDCVKKKGCNLSFQLLDNPFLVAEDIALGRFLGEEASDEGESGDEVLRGICLVSGEEDAIVRLHPAIGGVGEKPIPLAAINDGVSPAFSSFGKSQGYNFPVGARASFAYATALRHLLQRDSRQKVRVADAVVVSWAENTSGAEFESAFLDFLNPPRDDPDAGTRAVASLYRCVRDGKPFTANDDQRFFVLGLSANVARIVVRFWHVASIAELGVAFRRYFNEVEIARPAYDADAPLSLLRLLASTALLGEVDNIPRNLGGDVMRAILTGGRYPESLMQGVLRRIRADVARKKNDRLVENVPWPRAALLKAYLIRNLNDKEIIVSLNEENTDPGYRLGRLFAALERVQERAQGNLNASIRERYYGAFSATPVTVLPLLMKLKNHHLAKLPNRGEAVNLEKLLGAIVDGLGDVPARLSLAQQARFAVGYYHQRQAFFVKPDTETPDQSAD
jgi:CRISPR-associated protein Csd1